MKLIYHKCIIELPWKERERERERERESKEVTSVIWGDRIFTGYCKAKGIWEPLKNTMHLFVSLFLIDEWVSNFEMILCVYKH